jgi:16S rRNA (cytosine967-C5)-methyltransferase
LPHDATRPLPFPEGAFDRILVDAPCTGLGTVRRSPEIKWRVTRDDPAALARAQLAILASCAKHLKRGGVMVYSVCTVTDEEGPGVAEAFLKGTGDFSPSSPPASLKLESMMTENSQGHPLPFIRTWPHRHGTDGFFIARMVKS